MTRKTAEHRRLETQFPEGEGWKKWGPYLSERQWGTIKVECPSRSGTFVTLNEAANEIARRLTRIFLADASGRRPLYSHHPLLQTDRHFRDHILFYEYFHGDNGRGCGASRQTGWTGLVAKLLMPRYAHTELS